MSDVTKAFIEGLGRPNPRLPSGLHFNDPLKQVLWEQVYGEIGAGWFLDRFVYLFGPGLERLQPCLDAWPSLVPSGHPDRMILGRNAYGAVLVMEHEGPIDETTHLLDPATGRYWTDERIGLMNLFGAWLPQGLIPGFLDREPYRAWVQANGPLGDDEILAPITPLARGGAMTPENLERRDVVDYHRAAAAAFASGAQESGRPSRPKGKKRKR
jgi:hypothetical protein